MTTGEVLNLALFPQDEPIRRTDGHNGKRNVLIRLSDGHQNDESVPFQLKNGHCDGADVQSMESNLLDEYLGIEQDKVHIDEYTILTVTLQEPQSLFNELKGTQDMSLHKWNHYVLEFLVGESVVPEHYKKRILGPDRKGSP